MELIDALDAAFDVADADDEVRVVVLAANGKHFSSGHDLKELVGADSAELRELRSTPEGKFHHEQKMYVERCRRIHDFRKPTIAAVQGKCIAGGLMLACMCDIIVAADDAVFSNPVLRMSGAAVELLVEPWELGIRQSKEFLLASLELDADEAMELGLVNRVVPTRRSRATAAAELAATDRPRAADYRRDREGLDKQRRRAPGQERFLALPLHGAPLRSQHRYLARRTRPARADGIDERGVRGARPRRSA